MFLETFKFELNYHSRQYGVYVMAAVVFLLFFMATTTPNVQIGGGGPNLNLNASMSIVGALGAVTFLSLLMSIAFTANSVVRDYDYKTIELFLSRPLSKVGFIYGRFLGSFVFGMLVYFAGLMGVLLGEFMPWLDPERLGPFSFAPYVYGTLVLGLPNMLLFSCIFFCAAAITRSLAWTYVFAVGFFMLNLSIGSFTERDMIELTSMLDPFGSTAVEQQVRYWTPFESNNQLPAFEGAILVNRVLWLSIAACALLACYKFFPFTVDRRRKLKKEKPVVKVEAPTSKELVQVQQLFGFGAEVQQFVSQTRLEARNIMTSVPFIIVMLLGMVQVVGTAFGDLGSIVGTSVYPTTGNLVTLINQGFTIPLFVVLVYMSGEMMSREQASGSAEIMDAMPYPNWIMVAAKWFGLCFVIVLMLVSVTLGVIGAQLFKGFYDIDLVQYALGLLFFFQFPLYLSITLSIFFYVLTQRKFIAMFLMMLYVVSAIALPMMGYEDNLYSLTEVGMPHSDFTGYDQNLVPHLWQTFYWGLFGCLLLLATHLLWQRGGEADWTNRLKVAKARLSMPTVLAGWAFATLFVAVGGFIYYNTHVLNEYRTSDDLEALQADYEKQYKQYQDRPVVEVTDLYVEVDIFPKEREVFAKGIYELANNTALPIDEIHITDPNGIQVNQLNMPASELVFDEVLGYRIYKLEQPIAPGEKFKVPFEVEWLTPGFANNGHSVKLTSNGTFFNNADVFPAIGYQSGFELQDNNTRREHDLGPVQRQKDIDDESGKYDVGFGSASRIGFEAIVSTDVGQIAIAPGYLQKDWQENDRHYYHYKMDSPIWNFMSFMSADYQVKKDKWQDVDIEVYYIHDYNVDAMIESTKESLAYFSESLSPYQYRQFRIMEFPNYQGRFAQSFPNTIPFSESIGFTADLRDKKEINYVYYVTAHELAHQWWAHQVLGANVQGQTMIIETLAQYSALMVMEKKYGKAYMQKFLSFELDSYLSNRGAELIEELPLYRVENQPYVHYRKGSVVFYALKDLIGEEAINDALAAFIDEYAFKPAPYPTTRELIALIRERAAPEFQNTIDDLFEKIVLFELKVDDADVVEKPDGQFEVSFDVIAKKFEATGEGVESEVPIADWIDIAVLGEKTGEAEVPELLHIEKVYMEENSGTYTVLVDQKPVSVGIDPLNKRIDRNPDDNVKDV